MRWKCIGQPLKSFCLVGMIKVANLRFGKRFAKHRHHLLPFLLTNYGKAIDIGKVFEIEFDVFRSNEIPAKNINIKLFVIIAS